MKVFVSELLPNQTVSSTFLVKSKELKSKKTGGNFVLITLSDRTGDIVGQWRDNFEDCIDTFDRDDIVLVRGMVNSYRNHLQLAVHRVRRCEDHEIDPSHYFPVTRFSVDEMFAELMTIIGGMTNVYLKQLLERVFADETTVRKFKRAPAAKTMHHPYLGGLLEHSLSLVKLCDKVSSHYPGIDRDLLLTGAVLHDFGKIDELSYERGFGYTDDGQMIGHLTMEVITVSELIQELDGFPLELRRHLLHMLLSHHGKLEYGSPKLPMTPEALMLAYLDDLDSKVEAMQRLMAEPNIQGDWTRMAPMFERPIYRRRPNDPNAPNAPNAVDNGVRETTGTAATPAAPKPAKVEKPRTEPASQSFNRPFEHLAEWVKK